MLSQFSCPATVISAHCCDISADDDRTRGDIGGHCRHHPYPFCEGLRAPRDRRMWEGLMKLPRRTFLHLAAGAAAFPTITPVARAQAWPAQPITLIVPFAPGGPNDRIARIMAERMSVSLGQPVVVENVDGAAGSVGTGRLARAAPDGYSISIGYWGTHVANAAIYTLDYDVVRDFEPISLLVESPLLIAAKNSVPAKDLGEFVSWLRENPNKASSAVPGSASHVTSVFFQRETGTSFRLVPYRGAGPAIEDLSQERIDIALLDAGPPLARVRSGEFKAY